MKKHIIPRAEFESLFGGTTLRVMVTGWFTDVCSYDGLRSLAAAFPGRELIAGTGELLVWYK